MNPVAVAYCGKTYLAHAHKIASAAIEYMTNEDGILTEVLCELGNCNAD